MAAILEICDVSLRFGGVRALTHVSLAVEPGELFSIIGPNGAGKTSLLNCVSGRYKPTEGTVFYKGGDITRRRPADRAKLGIGRTFQNLALFQHMSVLDNIMVGRHHLLRNNFLTGSIARLTWVSARTPPNRNETSRISSIAAIQPSFERFLIVSEALTRTGIKFAFV